jgi:hypothetical protein
MLILCSGCTYVGNCEFKYHLFSNTWLLKEKWASRSDSEGIPVDGGRLKQSRTFPILAPWYVSATGRLDSDMERRLAQASKAFGALRKPVFLDHNLTTPTKEKTLWGMCPVSMLDPTTEPSEEVKFLPQSLLLLSSCVLARPRVTHSRNDKLFVSWHFNSCLLWSCSHSPLPHWRS